MRSRKLALLLLALTVIPNVGCRPWYHVRDAFYYCEPIDEAIVTYNCNRAAKAAWLARKDRFCDRECLDHFGAGFRAGYADVAMGGTGCPPPLPPRRYWGWRYQNCEGQQCVAGWFDGYPAGARAAEEDGVANWSRMQTSYLIDAQYAARMPGARRGGPTPPRAMFPGEELEEIPATMPTTAPITPVPTPDGTPVEAPVEQRFLPEETLRPAPTGDHGALRDLTAPETTVVETSPTAIGTLKTETPPTPDSKVAEAAPKTEAAPSALRRFDMPAVEVLSGVSVPKKQLLSVEPAPEVSISETTPIESSEPEEAEIAMEEPAARQAPILAPVAAPRLAISPAPTSGVIAETPAYSLGENQPVSESTSAVSTSTRSLPPIVPSKATRPAPPIIRSLKERGRVTKLERPSPTKQVSFEGEMGEETPVLRRLETSK